MVDHRRIYDSQAEEYDALVSAEDCDGHLLPALEEISRLYGAEVLEVGIGTGRIARLVAPRVARIVGVDRSNAMLEVARTHLSDSPTPHELVQADAVALPVASGWADLAVAGWVFGHLRQWMEAEWKAAIGQALDEMSRALKPGGALVVIETLGTGSEVPEPPTPALAEYYAWLETARGLARKAIRTDYYFEDVETAARTTGFFFGEPFAARVRAERWKRIPECTGIWWRRGGANGEG